MRLWHKDLIEYLPRQQLLGQWRECCAIARRIYVLGKPNHILVNRIMDYDIKHFIFYSAKVAVAMKIRGYSCDWKKFTRYFPDQDIDGLIYVDNYSAWMNGMPLVFPHWHDYNYLDTCYYNLKEKYDCGGIPDDEWVQFERGYFDVKSRYANGSYRISL